MGELSLPADYPTIPPGVYDEIKLVKLAREIAMGIKEVPDILRDNGVTLDQFATIRTLPYFTQLLTSELAAWSSANNTPERVKVKAGSMLEEYLPELYARMNDPSEPLMAKVKAVEVAARLAGLGERDIQPTGAPGERVQVIINLGADTQLEYRKQLPPKVINNDLSLQQNLESVDAGSNQV